MEAENFADLGFKKWHKVSTLSASDLKGAGEIVFVLRQSSRGRKTPEVRFIGRSKRPVKKILGGIISGSGGKAAIKIHRALMKGNAIDSTSISWKASKDSKAEQRKLLSEYKSKHGSLPSWNGGGKQKPGKAKPPKTTKAKKVGQAGKPRAKKNPPKGRNRKPRKTTKSRKPAVTAKPTP